MKKLALAMIFASCLTTVQAGQANAAEQFTPVVARAIAPVRPVVATDGKKHLAYELLVSNYSSAPATIKRINRFAGGRRLAPISGSAVSSVLKPFGSASTSNVLAPGESGYILLDLRFRPRTRPPSRINHQFVVSASNLPLKFTSKYRSGPVRVLNRAAVEVRPPLRGAGWIAANGCCAEFTSHRAAVLPVNGSFFNSERYAIDFMQIQPDSRLVTGPWESLSSYPFFGDPVISATRGKVVRVVSKFPETQPSGNLPPPSAAGAGGNYIVVRRGPGQFAFYAHLQPGSAKVRVGQKVKAGQVLGSLGSSGNSNAPHLHFHMMDKADPVASNGIPYTFTRFGVVGRLQNFGDLFEGTPAEINSRFAGIHRRQLPLNLQVVDFPNR